MKKRFCKLGKSILTLRIMRARRGDSFDDEVDESAVEEERKEAMDYLLPIYNHN